MSDLARAGRVLVTGPAAPDGDSVGACLALARELRRRGARDVVVGGDLPVRYRWVPDADTMVTDSVLDRGAPFDAVVVLDGDRFRLTRAVEARFAAAPIKAIIDHHGSTDPAGYTHTWLEPACESTCGMVLRALLRWQVPLDRDIAALLYTGLVFDTGGFRHPNTTPETHRLAAALLATGIDHSAIGVRVLAERTPEALTVAGVILQHAIHHDVGGGVRVTVGRAPASLLETLGRGDLEGVVDALLTTVGTEVAALLVERNTGSVKYSLRSRSSRVDVAKLARRLHPTGGGHPRAAGASFRGTLDEAEQSLLHALRTATDP